MKNKYGINLRDEDIKELSISSGMGFQIHFDGDRDEVMASSMAGYYSLFKAKQSENDKLKELLEQFNITGDNTELIKALNNYKKEIFNLDKLFSKIIKSAQSEKVGLKFGKIDNNYQDSLYIDFEKDVLVSTENDKLNIVMGVKTFESEFTINQTLDLNKNEIIDNTTIKNITSLSDKDLARIKVFSKIVSQTIINTDKEEMKAFIGLSTKYDFSAMLLELKDRVFELGLLKRKNEEEKTIKVQSNKASTNYMK